MKSIVARMMGVVVVASLVLVLTGCNKDKGGSSKPADSTAKNQSASSTPPASTAGVWTNKSASAAPAPAPTPTPTPAPAPKPAAKKLVIRVDAGSEKAWTDAAGNIWEADSGFEGGENADRGDIKIEGTDKAPLYRTEHWGMASWSHAVPNGKYTVRLHFAETFEGAASVGGRIFTVTAGDNKQEITELDVFKEAGAANKAVVKELPGVEVTNGKLTITFGASTQAPEINAIEVIQE